MHKEFQGGTIENPSGAMFCIWCDYPGDKSDSYVVAKTKDTIEAFGKTLPESVSESVKINESYNTNENKFTVGSSVTLTLSNNDKIVAYDSTDTSVVSLEGKQAEKNGEENLASDETKEYSAVVGTALKPGSSTITLTDTKGRSYTTELTVAADRNNPVEKNITVTVNSDYTETLEGDLTAEELKYDNSVVNVKTELQKENMDSQGTVTTEAKDQTLVTFTGIKEGETSVQIGTVKYNIKVVNENIDDVKPITVEYWITNRKVVINKNEEETSKEIKATDPNVYSETGAKVSDLLPNEGTIKGDNTSKTAYWKTTLLDTDHKQTEDKGVNQTLVGNDFIYIRYWRNKWSVSSNGNDWSEIEDTDQIVAYYLQVTAVTKEVTTKVVDWGVNYKNYTPESFVMMDYAVKYQSGQRTPEKFPVDKTLAFHCDWLDRTSVHYDDTLKEYYREIGLIKADETADYEVYMITMTPSSDKSNDYVGNSASSVTSCNYAGTEKVVWVDDEKDLGYFKNANLHAEGYHVGGEAIVPGVKITNKHAMLITYYVRAKVTDDSLQVHYIDKTTNTEFYNYNIAVKQGTTFKENIKLPEGGKGNLINGEVVNNTDGTQVVSSDLSTMPEIGADYRYSTYTCESVTTSEDKKIVTLYYTFDNIHKFVVDYGLPLVITSNDLGLNTTDWTSAEASTNKYGKVDLNSEKHTLTYTPSQVLPEVETINLNLIDDKTKKPATHIIYIYPATTVYYEETFVEKGKGAEELAVQTTSQCGNSSANYGFDNTYAVNGDNLNNNTLILTGTNEESFNFKGTGVDVYANTIAQENEEDTDFSGTMMVKVFKNDTIVKIVTVDTRMQNGKSSSTNFQAVNGKNVPVVTLNLSTKPEEYTLKVRSIKSGNDGIHPVYLDGFCVYNTIKDAKTISEVYNLDNEANPTYYELRDQVLASVNITTSQDKRYANEIAHNTLSQVYASAGIDKTNAIVVSGDDYKDIDVQDLLNNGPKNELYLSHGQSVVFSLNQAAQIGLKGVNGNASYSVTGATINNENVNTVSTTDMFYRISAGNSITITNTGNTILSITKIKAFNTTNAAEVFAPLTEETLTTALVGLGYEKAPAPTATPTPTQKPAQQIKLDTPKLDKVAAVGHNALKVSWSRVKNADGYRVYVKENGKWKTVGDTKSTSYVHKNLKTGKSYTYTVKAYKKTADGTVWSSYNKKGITGKTVLKVPKLRRVKRNSAKKATLTWNKVDGANGYVVYRKTNNGSWKAVKRITKGNVTSFTDTKLSKGKKYTYTVRAYCTVDKKNVYSGYDKKGLTVK